MDKINGFFLDENRMKLMSNRHELPQNRNKQEIKKSEKKDEKRTKNFFTYP